MSNQKIDLAIDFLVEEKAKQTKKHEEDIQRRNEIMWVSYFFKFPLCSFWYIFLISSVIEPYNLQGAKKVWNDTP